MTKTASREEMIARVRDSLRKELDCMLVEFNQKYKLYDETLATLAGMNDIYIDSCMHNPTPTPTTPQQPPIYSPSDSKMEANKAMNNNIEDEL